MRPTDAVSRFSSASYQAPGSLCSLASTVSVLLPGICIGTFALVLIVKYCSRAESAAELRKRFREAHHLNWWKGLPLFVVWGAVRYCVLDSATQTWRTHLFLIVLCLVYLTLFVVTEHLTYSYQGPNPLAWTWWRTLYRIILPLLLLADWHFQTNVLHYIASASLLASLALSSRPIWSSLAVGLALLPYYYSTALVAAALSLLGYSFAYPILIFVYTLVTNFGGSALEYASRQLALGWIVIFVVLPLHFISSAVIYMAHDFFLLLVPTVSYNCKRATSRTPPPPLNVQPVPRVNNFIILSILGLFCALTVANSIRYALFPIFSRRQFVLTFPRVELCPLLHSSQATSGTCRLLFRYGSCSKDVICRLRLSPCLLQRH